MRLILTGPNCFTGMWICRALSEAGHEVIALFRGAYDSYTDLKKGRIDTLLSSVEGVFDCPYGSERFFEVLKSTAPDLFCHHAACVTNYKSPDFDPVAALGNNTGSIRRLIDTLEGAPILLTGSVFEQGEGAGSDGLRAVSPYGLSKGLTSEMFRFYCGVAGVKLAKFVIPNPFGPYEEFRFTSFMMKTWSEGKVGHVSQPAYVRDNIHVSLLAKAYADFAEKITTGAGFQKLNPSGYPESQGAFTERFAKAMRTRLQLPCAFTVAKQIEFPEPKVRINTDFLTSLQWDEEKAWDACADYYSQVYACHEK